MSPRLPYPYGNFPHYYTSQRPAQRLDSRLASLSAELFAGRKVLDIGCNDGTVTLQVAANYDIVEVLGVDLDYTLINKAVEQWETWEKKHRRGQEAKLLMEEIAQLPLSYRQLFQSSGDYDALLSLQDDFKGPRFPANVNFEVRNIVSDGFPSQAFDTILCLSILKWIQLNWGDDGVKSLLQGAYEALSPGGFLVLEVQEWSGYKKLKNQCMRFRSHYDQIRLRPAELPAYILSLGFALHSVSAVSDSRPVYVYRKL